MSSPEQTDVDERIGKVLAVVGPVVDVEFSTEELPPIYQALRICLLYTSPSPRDATLSRMPSSA